MKVRLKFEPRDLWIGVYWNLNELVYGSTIEVYVCLFPTLPVKFAAPYNPWHPGSAETHNELKGWRKAAVFTIAYCCGLRQTWLKHSYFSGVSDGRRGFDFGSEAAAEHFVFLCRAIGVSAKTEMYCPF